jgi:two-component system heavy metal sensor histidine kinase CusS
MARPPSLLRSPPLPLSLSLRLGLLFAAIAAAVCMAVGAYLYQTLSGQMTRRDDVDLLNKACLVRQLLHDTAAAEAMPRRLRDAIGQGLGQDGIMLRAVAPSGRVLLDTMPDKPGEPIAAVRLPVPVPFSRDPERADIAAIDLPAGQAHLLAMMVGDADGGRGALRVTLARTRSDRLAILKRYAADLLGALAAGVALATLLGFVAVRRGLRPLYGMAAKADDINAARLNTRLPVAGLPAELRPLSMAFNAMLDRLEEGIQRLSGFAADLAHDLRTPVNALMMQTQVALSRERSADDYQALLASSMEEYERLSRMIENTLFLARADNARLALRREPLDVCAELSHVHDYFEMLAEDKGVTLTLGALPAAKLLADAVLLRRAVNNLVSNAIAHTPRGGTIVLAARDEAGQDTQGASGWMVLEVTNTGSTIGAEHIERVFERYYRADRARESRSSAGLGLAIVRAIMALHGGSVQAESAGGRTVFTLRFPQEAALAGG